MVSRRKNLNEVYWKLAQKYISGGTMLYSKRPDLYLPKGWPTYFSKAKGCKLWDLNNKPYLDTCMMGIGTSVLGYNNSELNKFVFSKINKAVLTTLNCPEEVLLAKKLIKLHPWFDQVKFARTGGEANAIAIRIARAAKSNSAVAVCGYHGWHDWYLALNVKKKKELNNHLMNKLRVDGVPKGLKNLIYSFNYNDLKKLEYLIKKKGVKIVKMEVIRNIEMKNNFLSNVRKLCDKYGCILIFDECTTGFRETIGGLHKLYKVKPDMAIFGKALGNGFPITAVLGKKKIMQCADNTFISSTFWTERVGPSAGLKTIEIMERKKTNIKIVKLSNLIKKSWLQIAKKNNLKINIYGANGNLKFKFETKKDNNIYKTLITEKMLEKGFLATMNFYVSIAHTPKIINRYIKALEKVFKIIFEIENNNNYKKYLKSPLATKDFKRYN